MLYQEDHISKLLILCSVSYHVRSLVWASEVLIEITQNLSSINEEDFRIVASKPLINHERIIIITMIQFIYSIL
jgi:hypothetical protein